MRNHKYVMAAVCGVFFFLSSLSLALAQVPGSAEPGRIPGRFAPPTTPQAAPEITIPGPKAPLPPAKAAAIHFQLTSVAIEGSTVYSKGDLAPLYAKLVGKNVSLAQVYELRDAITAKYRKDGYILSQATIPPQKIVGGVIHIQIVEGYIDKVEIQGHARDSRGLISRMANKITASRPLRDRVLERYVLLINDLPGISARTVLRPAQNQPGAADLIVVLSRKAIGGFASVDNRGSRAIGPEEGVIHVDLNSMLGLDEHTSVAFATTGRPKELQYGAIESDWFLGSEGAELGLFGSYSHTEPGGTLAALRPLGSGWAGHISLTYPLIRSRSKSLHVGLSFGFHNTRTDLLGTKFSEDRVRDVSIDARFDFADTLFGDSLPATSVITARASQGLDILNATRTGSAYLSRANGHSDFTDVYVEAVRLQDMPGPFSLALSAAGQASRTPLLATEQFGLGGAQFGRGYEPSELTGDEGLAGSAEARYTLPVRLSWLTPPQLYAFYDCGVVWNIDPSPGTPRTQSLTSAGAGFRVELLNQLMVNFELAKPLTRDIASRGNRDVRPLFSITEKF